MPRNFRLRLRRTDDFFSSRAGGGGVKELTSAGGIGKSWGFVSYLGDLLHVEHMLQKAYLLAKIGFDTAENEPAKYW